MSVSGHFIYKGLTIMQHPNVEKAFEELLIDLRPTKVLEIGTSSGGLTLMIRDILDRVGLSETRLVTYDVHEPQYLRHHVNNGANIDIRVENIFNHSYLNLEKPEAVESFIKGKGLTLVLCDGWHKKAEFKQLAHLIKPGDVIMAHDYINTYDNFTKNFLGKIWDWREIGDDDIEEVCKQLNLESYFEESLNKVVWVCKIKK